MSTTIFIFYDKIYYLSKENYIEYKRIELFIKKSMNYPFFTKDVLDIYFKKYKKNYSTF